ncbi:two-component system chemotaxis sensor kinase CheA [Clostridium tetanomorphum]|uniref:Chemotaxis protein CheA n=1 Tax=Clostridium tetanomorphum TaxID=1553 RepID=A0A923E9Z6_CLOTT|nr:chemotaxis protein CheA [Clostridium tetanomorphum]KAJ51279.1 CheA signal transduction histidine kinase [Clostridium tetanomorphum DSM 665]KAJ52346.1 CheA signal transduction histidine kinase [Clostridium tetanomorphum DSM 665]MBC2397866.1 chemotaxis protein CheA [Clostridium tetanomorphum]MBP1864819.1 two-component system chemotaxis sensor kinase CheA [Clostridium tetanomorphum]NRS83995.1 two-component system chemotaxis sensor kinase CheA [Clostridium tetanomorphum]
MNNFNVDDIYMNMFLEETKEQIEKMEEDLISLENSEDTDEIINRIFRMAHSIKGSAATIGFEEMSNLAHNVESLLDKIREKSVFINDDIMDVLLESVDMLKSIHAAITKGETCHINVQSLMDDIEKFTAEDILEEIKCIPKSIVNKDIIKECKEFCEEELFLTEEENALCSKVDTKLDVYKIKIAMNKGTKMKSVKGFLIQNNLNGISEIIKIQPEDFEKVCEETYDGILDAIIATTKNYDDIYKNIKSISEIDKVYIKKVKDKPCCNNSSSNTKSVIEKSVCKKEEASTIRIDVNKVDKLLNLVGEFIIDKEALSQISQELKAKYKNDPLTAKLSNVLSHINYISEDLQETVMSTRMLPLENIFNRFPRMVRDLAKKCNKKINFIIEGQQTEIDRGIIEELIDPITHIIRNAVDHGIEEVDERKNKGKNEVATLKLSAKHLENNVVIEIAEDGRGIDVEKIKGKVLQKKLATEEELKSLKNKDIISFIFEAGFSTADKVSDISGRGVGLDVVKSNIGKLNGIIDIETELGEGTKFIIKLPLTLAIVQALLIKEDEYTFAIPITSIIETIRLKDGEVEEKIHMVNGIEVYKWREQIIPIIRIGKFFDLYKSVQDNKMFLVIVGYSEKRVGFIVDKLLGEREIVIKSIGEFTGENKLMGPLKGISGVSILGDGSFAQVIDVPSIIKGI